eukprot:CAMPEP_0184313104 /NCGR_PEP_ID=MMETSP1049-20130417/59089_1 /TAXON_ID=77928 /ORGANISM="Proteomonas sulcata, Strain CCMP704" /LENGTH=38 /DNA_ID= /DNA_START= /DNA_END= /DNA_ORIENTATION=
MKDVAAVAMPEPYVICSGAEDPFPKDVQEAHSREVPLV